MENQTYEFQPKTNKKSLIGSGQIEVLPVQCIPWEAPPNTRACAVYTLKKRKLPASVVCASLGDDGVISTAMVDLGFKLDGNKCDGYTNFFGCPRERSPMITGNDNTLRKCVCNGEIGIRLDWGYRIKIAWCQETRKDVYAFYAPVFVQNTLFVPAKDDGDAPYIVEVSMDKKIPATYGIPVVRPIPVPGDRIGKTQNIVITEDAMECAVIYDDWMFSCDVKTGSNRKTWYPSQTERLYPNCVSVGCHHVFLRTPIPRIFNTKTGTAIQFAGRGFSSEVSGSDGIVAMITHGKNFTPRRLQFFDAEANTCLGTIKIDDAEYADELHVF
jgi:hypothetical protein